MKRNELPADEEAVLRQMAETCQQILASSSAVLKENNSAVGNFAAKANAHFSASRHDKANHPYPEKVEDHFHARYLDETQLKEFGNYRNVMAYVPPGIYGVIMGNLDQEAYILGRSTKSFREFNYAKLCESLMDYFSPAPRHLGKIHFTRDVAKIGEVLRSIDADAIQDDDDRARAKEIQTTQLPELEIQTSRLGELYAQWKALHARHSQEGKFGAAVKQSRLPDATGPSM